MTNVEAALAAIASVFSLGGAAIAGHARGAYVARLGTDCAIAATNAGTAKATQREETSRHKIGVEALSEQLTTEKTEHGQTRKALTESIILVGAVKRDLAKCERDRAYQQRWNAWMAARADAVDGGSNPPPPLELEPETDES